MLLDVHLNTEFLVIIDIPTLLIIGTEHITNSLLFYVFINYINIVWWYIVHRLESTNQVKTIACLKNYLKSFTHPLRIY